VDLLLLVGSAAALLRSDLLLLVGSAAALGHQRVAVTWRKVAEATSGRIYSGRKVAEATSGRIYSGSLNGWR
jgi:hypothetical protein